MQIETSQPTAVLEANKLTPELTDQLRVWFEGSFYWSCKAIFESSFQESWMVPHVHRSLCDTISDHLKNPRLAIIFPRAWLKSQVCSIYYPIWRAMLDPNFTCMIVQNTFTNATRKLAAIRTILRTNKLLQALFPERMPDSSCQVSAEAICLPREVPLAASTFEAAGVGTDITSRHVELFVEDDTIAPEYDHMTGDVYEPSDAQCEKAKGFHNSAEFILQDFEKSQRLVVGTRWRQNDLFTEIKLREPNYIFLERAVREDADGHPDPEGHLTYPERFSDAVLERIRQTVGDYMFSSLMLSTPLNPKHALFKTDDILTYVEAPLSLAIFTTVDPAPPDSKTASPDYNIVMTTGVSMISGDIYVLDYFRERCTPGELIEAILDHGRRFKPLAIGIEAVAYQKTLEWWLKETMKARDEHYSIEPLTTSHRAKLARIKGLEPLVANHRIFIREWMSHLRQEFLAFPLGAHDDLIDALAYQLQFWRHADGMREEQVEEDLGLRSSTHILQQLRGPAPRPGFPFDIMNRPTEQLAGQLTNASYVFGDYPGAPTLVGVA